MVDSIKNKKTPKKLTNKINSDTTESKVVVDTKKTNKFKKSNNQKDKIKDDLELLKPKKSELLEEKNNKKSSKTTNNIEEKTENIKKEKVLKSKKVENTEKNNDENIEEQKQETKKERPKKLLKKAIEENKGINNTGYTRYTLKTKKSFKDNFSFIKNNYSDIFLLFKYFLHWNISKIIILVWSIVLGFIAIIPIILIFLAYSLFTDVSLSMLINGMFNGQLLNDFGGNTMLMLIVAIYYIVFSYSNILLINVNNGYLDGSKLLFKSNNYFDLKKVIKYFNLTVVNFGILILPVILFAILIGILLLFSGSLNEVYTLVSKSSLNYFTILSFISLVLCLVLLIYLFYRVIFSYFIFTDKKIEDTNVSVFSYIKESFLLTKNVKNFFKFIFLLVLLIIITLPIKVLGSTLDNTSKRLNDYTIYKDLTEDQKDYLNSSNPYYYESLHIEFQGFSDKDIVGDLKINQIYIILYSILNFLILNGVFLMMYSSFYKRELQK